MSMWDSEIAASPLPTLLRHSAKRFPRHRAIVFGGQTLDYAMFDVLSDRFATALAAQGIQKGDRVSLYCVNSDAFAIAYFGIIKAGAIVVPINLLLNPEEIAFILSDAGAKAICYFDAFAQAVRSLRSHVPSLLLAVCIGKNKALEKDLLFSDMLTTTQAAPQIPLNPSEDLAAILYTSGTTGRPKGAMLTHRNLASNVASVMAAVQLIPGEDILIVVLPMFHAFAATACLLTPLLNGCTIVPLPRFDPETAANAIESEKATIFMGVPSIYTLLLRLPDGYVQKFRSLKYAISGGAAMPVEIMKQFEARFGKPIYEGDGPTECSPVTCVNPIGGLRKPASVGKPVPAVEMKIMDEHGQELSRGQIGEICVRGPNVMKGYWNLPKETAEAFFGDWFRTGDLGTEDEDGYFFILDRKKDVIIVNGMNVYPRTIEELLHKHPAIGEVAVIGEPDELHGEIPVAYIALRNGATFTSSAVRAFCREHLGRYEVPRKVYFMPELPKNAAGKIMKRALRRQGELERGIDNRLPGM